MYQSSGKRRTMSTAVTKPCLPKIQTTMNMRLKKTRTTRLFTNPTSSLLTKKQISIPKGRLATEATCGKLSTRVVDMHMGTRGILGGHLQNRLHKIIDDILQIFKQMNRLREQNGVISMKEDDQDDQFYLEPREITYNATLYQLNEEICRLKREAQEKIEKLICMAKYQPKFKKMIDKVLTEQSMDNVSENARKGKVAAMKAQRRLIQTRIKEEAKIGI